MRPLEEMLKNITAEMQNEIAKEIDARMEKRGMGPIKKYDRPLTMGRLEAMCWFHGQGRLAEALERGL